MRSEQEMYDLIIGIAKKEEKILAVYMNGSRTNANAPKDIFQDYDIGYVVTETNHFIQNKEWILLFGEILYMQYPDENPDYPHDKENVYGWLMQFTDGNRVDLHVETLEHAKEHIKDDQLCSILLDKQNSLPDIVEATDKDYWVKKPTEEQYFAVCNEFWWCSNNLAKGMWRKEMPYVQDMANFHVRKQLEKMLTWKAGILTDFTVSAGKSAKYLYRWIEKEEWEIYLSTYFGCETEAAWDAIERMCDLFTKVALWVGTRLGYPYNALEADHARFFLEHVRQLPEDATEIL